MTDFILSKTRKKLEILLEMMREAPKKIVGIFFLFGKILQKMVDNHDHAGVK